MLVFRLFAASLCAGMLITVEASDSAMILNPVPEGEVSGCAVPSCAVPSCAVPSCAAPVTTACDSCGHSCGGFHEGCSQCGVSMCGCGPCGACSMVAGCSVCGQNTCCWDCTYEEGIDIESLTDAAQSKMLYDRSEARLKFEVPEPAGVWLAGARMSSLGTKRAYVLPILDKDKTYVYETKVDVVIDGKKYFRKIKLDKVKAGSIISIKVAVPELPEGETPAINHEVEWLAAGGPGESKS